MTAQDKITEQPSRYDHLEQMSVTELLQHINEEDALVAEAVGRALPQIRAVVEAIEPRMKRGGRLFYIGAGTSGRLGVLDASELPPTFGVPETWVVGIIAGGDEALRHAVERAEDIAGQGWRDLLLHHPTKDDTVIFVRGIQDGRPNEIFWDQLCDRDDVSITMDLFDYGLAILKPRFFKQHYVVSF